MARIEVSKEVSKCLFKEEKPIQYQPLTTCHYPQLFFTNLLEIITSTHRTGNSIFRCYFFLLSYNSFRTPKLTSGRMEKKHLQITQHLDLSPFASGDPKCIQLLSVWDFAVCFYKNTYIFISQEALGCWPNDIGPAEEPSDPGEKFGSLEKKTYKGSWNSFLVVLSVRNLWDAITWTRDRQTNLGLFSVGLFSPVGDSLCDHGNHHLLGNESGRIN